VKAKYVFLVLFLSFFILCVQHPQQKAQIEEKINLSEILNPKLVDDTGYPIKPNTTPKRIVSLAPSNTEILFAIGAGKQVVGVTDYCNYPPEVLEKKRSGELKSVGGYSTVNIERVLALKPDLVVASYGNGLPTIQTLRNYGLYVIAFNPKNMSDVMKDIILMGIATGHYKEAKQLVLKMAKKIENVKEKVKGKRRVRVAHIVWHDPIWVSGRDTFVDDIIRIAGGENVFNFSGWRVIGVEDLISANPEVIIVNSGTGMGGNKNVIYDWVMSDSRLKVIDAVKNHRVYVIDADIICRPSYRLADAVEIIARFLHPECFE